MLIFYEWKIQLLFYEYKNYEVKFDQEWKIMVIRLEIDAIIYLDKNISIVFTWLNAALFYLPDQEYFYSTYNLIFNNCSTIYLSNNELSIFCFTKILFFDWWIIFVHKSIQKTKLWNKFSIRL